MHLQAKTAEPALRTTRETRSCLSLEISGHAVLFSKRDRMDQMDQRETVKRTAGSMQHMLPGTRGDLLSIQSHDLNNELDLCCQTFLRRSRELHKAMVVKEWTRTKLPGPGNRVKRARHSRPPDQKQVGTAKLRRASRTVRITGSCFSVRWIRSSRIRSSTQVKRAA